METDCKQLENDFHSGLILIRDLDSFVFLERRLHEELTTSQTQARCDDKIPLLPVDINDLLSTKDGEASKAKDDLNENVQAQFIAARLSDYIASLLQMPEVVRSKAMEDFLAFRDNYDFKNAAEGEILANGQPGQADSKSLAWITEQLRRMIIPNFEKSETVKQDSNEAGMSRCKRDFYEFFFQASELDEVAISIPRRGRYTHYETVPPGWWLVFRITTLLSSPSVQFNLSISQSESEVSDIGNSSHQHSDATDKPQDESQGSSASNKQCIVSEDIGQETHVAQYSYRCEPESVKTEASGLHFDGHIEAKRVRYVMEFSNESSMFRSAQLRLCIRCVPHEAFKAACYAVRDQLEADMRRQRCPLLCQVLDSVHSDPVSLTAEPFSPEDFPGLIYVVHSEASDNAVNEHQIEELAEEEQSITRHAEEEEKEKPGQISLLESELSALRSEGIRNKEEITRLNGLVNELQGKLHIANAEKRVWSLAQQEIQQEMRKLARELEEARSELSRMRKEKDLLRVRVDKTSRQTKKVSGVFSLAREVATPLSLLISSMSK